MIRQCPLCHRETAWAENPWRPFCSERCQMLDLGRWMDEEYAIPMAETSEDLTSDFDLEAMTDEQV